MKSASLPFLVWILDLVLSWNLQGKGSQDIMTSCPPICTISSICLSYLPLKRFEGSVSVVPQQSISVLQLSWSFDSSVMGIFLASTEAHCFLAFSTTKVAHRQFPSLQQPRVYFCYAGWFKARSLRSLPALQLLFAFCTAGRKRVRYYSWGSPVLSRWKISCFCLAHYTFSYTSPCSFAVFTALNCLYCPRFFSTSTVSDKTNICYMWFLLLSSSLQEGKSVWILSTWMQLFIFFLYV